MVKRTKSKYHPRSIRSIDDLRAAACTMTYEHRMFIASARVLMNRPPRATDQMSVLIGNMALESSLIHARNLRDFFSPNGRKDDILARDFVSPLPRIALPYLRNKSTDRRLNRLLAHPSYSRTKLVGKWDISTLCREVEAAWQSFLRRLEDQEPGLRKLFR